MTLILLSSVGLIVHAADIAHGASLTQDFTAFYAAARLTLAGHAGWAYSPAYIFPIERALTPSKPIELIWNYPPPLSLIISPLANLPLKTAFAVWNMAGMVALAGAMGLILRDLRIALFAFAAPAVALCLFDGQSSLFTAALFGAGMALLQPRPVLAGALLGCLCCKPHLAGAAVFVLVVSGHWRALAGLVVSALGLCAASLLVCGPDTWCDFFAALPRASQALEHGWIPWAKIPSAFVAARSAGAPVGGALAAQLAEAGMALTVSWRVWRGPAPYAVKVAVASIASVMLSPYVYDYDLTFLVVGVAFLAQQLRSGELLPPVARATMIVLICAPVLVSSLAMWTHMQAGPFILLGSLLAIGRPWPRKARTPALTRIAQPEAAIPSSA